MDLRASLYIASGGTNLSESDSAPEFENILRLRGLCGKEFRAVVVTELKASLIGSQCSLVTVLSPWVLRWYGHRLGANKNGNDHQSMIWAHGFGPK